jgi:hypothetical protein
MPERVHDRATTASRLGCLLIKQVRFLVFAGQEYGCHDGDRYKREGYPVRVSERVRGMGRAPCAGLTEVPPVGRGRPICRQNGSRTC